MLTFGNDTALCDRHCPYKGFSVCTVMFCSVNAYELGRHPWLLQWTTCRPETLFLRLSVQPIRMLSGLITDEDYWYDHNVTTTRP